MITASLLGESEAIETYRDVRSALVDLRRHWMESSDPDETIILHDGARKVGAIMREKADRRIMTVVHADGFVERHRCEYVSGADGRYLHTQVTALVA